MDSISIHSTQFTKLNATTKDLINMGEWFLYKISYPSVPTAQFYLSTDQMAYFLTEDGSVVEKTAKTPTDLVFLQQVSFDDLPKPQSLRNFVIKWK